MAKINVVFNDSTNETGVATQEAEQQVGQKPTDKTSSYLIGQAVVQLGKRGLSYGASQIGNLTGNYILQNKVDNAITIAGYAGQIGVGIATGGAVGGIVATIAVAGQIGINAFNYETDKIKANAQANYLMQQRGGILNDYSR
jgi:hypothetical protein